MKRLYGVLLALLVMIACHNDPVPEVTLRTPEMTNFEFLTLAEKKIEENFPQWYVKDINTVLLFNSPPWASDLFASVNKRPRIPLTMVIYAASWELTTVEDFASVLLHEYVHVTMWERLEAEIPDEDCRSAAHEVIAYTIEMEQDKFKVSDTMKRSTKFEYYLYNIDLQMYCPVDFDINVYLDK